MTGGFRVRPEALTAHVTDVDALAERASRAAASARPLRRAAYGLVGQVFADVADHAARTAARGVADLAAAARDHSEGVRIARDRYIRVDAAIAARLRGLR